MITTFELEGAQFMAFNGGPAQTLNHAASLFIRCETQEEVDYFWEKLGAGGREVQCGWLVDKFGLSWQVVPNILGDLLGDDDRAKADRAMQAMLGMVKLNIAALKKAHAG
jgi:predicted 3-demethylubiquinone-9 3-methyltransferase (glyoxalase superfamily)